MDGDFFLIRKMKNGDNDAIESFVRKYYTSILHYFRVHISDRGYAEDLTQEVFERFFRALPKYRHTGRTANYLYVVAGNLCKDYYKQKKELSMSELPEKSEDSVDAVDSRMDMENALGQLPDELREVIVLQYFQEMKLKEIAKTLDIGLPLVKYRVKKAKEQLEVILRKGDTL